MLTLLFIWYWLKKQERNMDVVLPLIFPAIMIAELSFEFWGIIGFIIYSVFMLMNDLIRFVFQ